MIEDNKLPEKDDLIREILDFQNSQIDVDSVLETNKALHEKVRVNRENNDFFFSCRKKTATHPYNLHYFLNRIYFVNFCRLQHWEIKLRYSSVLSINICTLIHVVQVQLHVHEYICTCLWNVRHIHVHFCLQRLFKICYAKFLCEVFCLV